MTSPKGISVSLHIHEEVQYALKHDLPVVALESTIIAQGLPFPSNLETARSLERIVRSHGAVPATIAVLGGVPHIGLTGTELEAFVSPRKGKGAGGVRKLGVRDLVDCFMRGADGATTVSATMFLAARAGIHVFATGGVGGVHRGVAESWDVSADIQALSSIPVLVVCAGIKSILDIEKTLQALESACVPVFVLGADKVPGFYVSDTGIKAPNKVQNTMEMASIAHMHHTWKMTSGMLLTVPIPKESEPDGALIQQAINKVLEELQRPENAHVKAGEITPFLLSRVAQLTGGKSLQANVALVQNNAAVAAQIAVQLVSFRKNAQRQTLLGSQLQQGQLQQQNNPFESFHAPSNHAHMAVIGAVVLDVVAHPTTTCRTDDGVRSTAAGRVSFRVGGVAWNVALAAARFSSAKVRLLTAVGNDAQSQTLVSLMRKECSDCANLDICAPTIECRHGAVVSLIHDRHGDLLTGIADTESLYGVQDEADGRYGVSLHSHWGAKLQDALRNVRVVVIDANLSMTDMRQVCDMARKQGVDIWLEPVSVAKCTRLIEANVLQHARYVSPNLLEANALARRLGRDGKHPGGVLAAAANAGTVLVTEGEKGLTVFEHDVPTRHFKAVALPSQVVSRTGAGDCFAGVCAARISKGADLADAIVDGMTVASASCVSEECVPPRGSNGGKWMHKSSAKL